LNERRNNMYRNAYSTPIHRHDQRFFGTGAIGPLGAGILGAGLGFLGGQLVGPGFGTFGPGYGGYGYPSYGGYPIYGGYGDYGYGGYGYPGHGYGPGAY
jgi:hypothetical protein